MGNRLSSAIDGGGGGGHRPWANLPAIALYAIATHHLTTLHDILALPRVCSTWRSVLKGTHHAFMASKPPLLLVDAPSPSNNNTTRLYSAAEDRTYKFTTPGIGDMYNTLDCTGYSHGQLIMVDKATRKNPILLDPITGARIDLPAAALRFSFGVLSAALTAPDCELFLVSDFTVQHRSVRGDHSRRQWKMTVCVKGFFSSSPTAGDSIVGAVADSDGVTFVTRSWHSTARLDLRATMPPLRSSSGFDWDGHDQAAELRRADGVFPAVGELDGERLMVPDARTALRLDPKTRVWVEIGNLGHRSLFVSSHYCHVFDVWGVEGVEGSCMYWAGGSEKEGNWSNGWGKLRLA